MAVYPVRGTSRSTWVDRYRVAACPDLPHNRGESTSPYKRDPATAGGYRRQLARAVWKKGGRLHRTKGGHQHYFTRIVRRSLPRPSITGSLKRGLLVGILKNAGIPREEFLELL